jgi:hypothetical protein
VLIYVGLSSGLDLHMSCGKETSVGPNRFESLCSSVLETRSTALHRSLIYETWLLVDKR